MLCNETNLLNEATVVEDAISDGQESRSPTTTIITTTMVSRNLQVGNIPVK
jgi:hypothetical protein